MGDRVRDRLLADPLLLVDVAASTAARNRCSVAAVMLARVAAGGRPQSSALDWRGHRELALRLLGDAVVDHAEARRRLGLEVSDG